MCTNMVCMHVSGPGGAVGLFRVAFGWCSPRHRHLLPSRIASQHVARRRETSRITAIKTGSPGAHAVGALEGAGKNWGGAYREATDTLSRELSRANHTKKVLAPSTSLRPSSPIYPTLDCPISTTHPLAAHPRGRHLTPPGRHDSTTRLLPRTPPT